MLELADLETLKGHTVTYKGPVILKSTGEIYYIRSMFELTGKGIPHNSDGYFLQKTEDSLGSTLEMNSVNVEFISSEERLRAVIEAQSVITDEKDILLLSDALDSYEKTGVESSIQKRVSQNLTLTANSWLRFEDKRLKITVPLEVDLVMTDLEYGPQANNDYSELYFENYDFSLLFSISDRMVVYKTVEGSDLFLNVYIPGTGIIWRRDHTYLINNSSVNLSGDLLRNSNVMAVTDNDSLLKGHSAVASLNKDLLKKLMTSASTDSEIPYLRYLSRPDAMTSDLDLVPKREIEGIYLSKDVLDQMPPDPHPVFTVVDRTQEGVELYNNGLVSFKTIKSSGNTGISTMIENLESTGRKLNTWTLLSGTSSSQDFASGAEILVSLVLSTLAPAAGNHFAMILNVSDTEDTGTGNLGMVYEFNRYWLDADRAAYSIQRIK